MARPSTRPGSNQIQFRCRVPAALVSQVRGQLVLVDLPSISGPPVTVSATAGVDIKFSLRTSDPSLAKLRHAAANTQVERYFNAWRSGPVAVTHKELVALSGEVYLLYVDKFTDDPGSLDDWAAFKAFNRAAQEGRLLNAPAITPATGNTISEAVAIFGKDLTAGVNSMARSIETASALESRFGLLADWVLQKHGIAVDDDTRIRLLQQVASAATDAAWALKRNAQGDYTPDPRATRFPAIETTKPAISLDALFERWKAEAKPAASTVTTWVGTVRSLTAHLGANAQDIRKITPEHIVAWKDTLVAKDLSPKTINASHLGSVNALLNFAVANRLLQVNPGDGIRVKAKAKAGTSQLPYDDNEVRQLLALAKNEGLAYRRWLPWLAASSGARIGELAQLWGNRIKEVDGHHVMHLLPAEDGGSIKNAGSERTVPIHPALINDGFLDFVRTRGEGPLFYRRSSGKAAKRHASKGTSNHLASWIRDNGFTDPRKAPNHAFRHYFKSALARADVSDSLADAIQGHAGKGEASRYRHFTIDDMAKAIGKLDIPQST